MLDPRVQKLLAGLPHTAEQIISAAQTLEYRGEPDAAIEVLNAAVATHATRDLRWNLARALMRRHQWRRALAVLIPILQQDHSDKTVLLAVCECLIENGDHDRAGRMLAQAAQAGVPADRVAQLTARLRKGACTADADATLERQVYEEDLPVADDARTYVDGHEDRTEALSVDPSMLQRLRGTSAPQQDATEEIDRTMVMQNAGGSTTDSALPTLNASSEEFAHLLQSIDDQTQNLSPANLFGHGGSGPSEPRADADASTGMLGASSSAHQRSEPQLDRTARSDPQLHLDAFQESSGAQELDSASDASSLDATVRSDPSLPLDSLRPHTPHASQPAASREDQFSQEDSGRFYQPQTPAPRSYDEVPFEEAAAQNSSQPDQAEQAEPLLGRPGPANRFAQPDEDLFEDDGSDLRVFNQPDDLFSLAGEDDSSAPSPSAYDPPSFANQQAPAAQGGQSSEGYQAPPHDSRQGGASSEWRPVEPDQQRPTRRRRTAQQPATQEPLELDYGDQAPPSSEPPPQQAQQALAPNFGAHQQGHAPPTPQGGGEDRTSERKEKEKKPKKPRKPLSGAAKAAIATTVGIVLLVGGFAGLIYGADSSYASSATTHIKAARAQMHADTRAGHEAAVEDLQKGLASASFLGEGFDTSIRQTLHELPGLQGPAVHRALLGELAAATAMLEHRWATPGAYKASEHLARAEQALGKDAPRVHFAAAHQLMLSDPEAALALAESATAASPQDLDLAATLIEAQLTLGLARRAHLTGDDIRDNPKLAPYHRYVLGRAGVAAGDASAAIELQKLLNVTDGEHLDAHMWMPRAAHLAGKDAPESLALLDGMLDEKSKHPRCIIARVYAAKAAYTLRTGTLKDARIGWMRGHETCPEAPDVSLSLASILVETGRIQEATSLLDTLDTQGVAAQLTAIPRVRIATLAGETDDALDAAEAVPITTPIHHVLRGDALMRQDNPLDAKKAYETAAALEDPDASRRASALLAGAVAVPLRAEKLSEDIADLADSHDRSTTVLHALAQTTHLHALHAQGDARRDLFTSAQRRYSEALSSTTLDAPILFDRCRMQLDRARLEAAIRDCADAHELNPADVAGALLYAKVLGLDGRDDEAVTALEKTASLFEAPAIALRAAKARAMLLRHSYDDADALLDQLAQEHADAPQVLLARGESAFFQGKYAAAYSALKKAHRATESPEAAALLGLTAARLGQLDSTRDLITPLLDEVAWSPYAHLAIAHDHRTDGDTRAAMKAIDEVLTARDHTATPAWLVTEAYIQRALAIAEDDGWSEGAVRAALDAARKEGDADAPRLHWTLGLYESRRRDEDVDAAADHFDRALRALPTHCPTLRAYQDILDDLDRQDDDIAAVKDAYRDHCTD